MSIEYDMSRVPRSSGAQCGVLLRKMKLMMEGQNWSINQTHGSTLVIFFSFVNIYPKIWYVKIRDYTSLLCGR